MTDLADLNLRRWPDLEADNLFAVDAADRLILDEAAPFIAADPAILDGGVVVIGDSFGALTLGAIAQYGATNVRVSQDRLLGEQALAANAKGEKLTGFRNLPLGAELLAGARVVLLALPRSLDALEEISALIAANAAADVTVVAGGRIKHITPAMNEVLKRHFGRFDISHARQKARAFISRDPLAATDAAVFPVREFHEDLGLWVVAHGGVFAGAKVDIGTRFLLSHVDRMKADVKSAIDLGSGSGVLAAALATKRPALKVLATDESAAAVASSIATAEANGVSDRVRVVRDVGLASQPDASADLIVLNPPFHVESTVFSGEALRLFEDAARVLRPGGHLWTVFNSHLGYKASLARLVGQTRQVDRNAKFTVTVSIKPR